MLDNIITPFNIIISKINIISLEFFPLSLYFFNYYSYWLVNIIDTICIYFSPLGRQWRVPAAFLVTAFSISVLSCSQFFRFF